MANIKVYLDNILKAIFGNDVRQSIHDGIEAINNDVLESVSISKNTETRQNLLEQKYDEQIRNIAASEPQNAEIVDARSGFDTLGSLLKKKIFFFVNVETMKNCLNLIPGDLVQTLGYYKFNDGGQGLYKIVNDSTLVNDGGSIHDLSNGLKAELIINDSTVNIKQFGALENGIDSDTEVLKAAINVADTILFNNASYYINGEFEINKSINFKGNNSKFIFDETSNSITVQGTTNSKIRFTCENITVEKTGSGYSLRLFNCEDFKITNLKFDGSSSNTYLTIREGCKNGDVSKCKFYSNRVGKTGGNINILAFSGNGTIDNIKIHDNYFEHGGIDENLAIYGRGTISNIDVYDNIFIEKEQAEKNVCYFSVFSAPEMEGVSQNPNFSNICYKNNKIFLYNGCNNLFFLHWENYGLAKDISLVDNTIINKATSTTRQNIFCNGNYVGTDETVAQAQENRGVIKIKNLTVVNETKTENLVLFGAANSYSKVNIENSNVECTNLIFPDKRSLEMIYNIEESKFEFINSYDNVYSPIYAVTRDVELNINKSILAYENNTLCYIGSAGGYEGRTDGAIVKLLNCLINSKSDSENNLIKCNGWLYPKIHVMFNFIEGKNTKLVNQGTSSAQIQEFYFNHNTVKSDFDELNIPDTGVTLINSNTDSNIYIKNSATS